MSLYAIQKVIEDTSLTGNYRLVMLAMADLADDFGYLSYNDEAISRFANIAEEDLSTTFYFCLQNSEHIESVMIRGDLYWRIMLIEQNECFYCGQSMIPYHGQPNSQTRDHMTPRSRGGSDDDSNIVQCCSGCNTMKGDRTLEEWRTIHAKTSGRALFVFPGEKKMGDLING